VPVATSSGFDSLTAKHHVFAEALERYEDYFQRTILLHVGDHDPSGVWMHESMGEDLKAFSRDHDDAPDDLIELRRVALAPQLIREYAIEPQPDAVKPTNTHSKHFLELGLEPAAQLEALPPDRLSEVVRQAVEDALDLDVLRTSQEQERLEREQVQEKLDAINAVLREAFGLS
jgi:hypothetical protein